MNQSLWFFHCLKLQFKSKLLESFFISKYESKIHSVYWKGNNIKKQRKGRKKHDLITQWKQNSDILFWFFPSSIFYINLGLKTHRQLCENAVGWCALSRLSKSLIHLSCCYSYKMLYDLSHNEVKPSEITHGLALHRTAQTRLALNHWPMPKKVQETALQTSLKLLNSLWTSVSTYQSLLHETSWGKYPTSGKTMSL